VGCRKRGVEKIMENISIGANSITTIGTKSPDSPDP
jgi:hypothetical protein